MKREIKLTVSSCDRCLENSPSQRKEPLVQTVASRPMEQTLIDLAQYGGKTYLVLADRFSGWLLFEKYARSPDQMAVCSTLNNCFLDFGRPVVIRSDGGPQFRSGFDAWCKKMAIRHELSSSYNPQSNGTQNKLLRLSRVFSRKQTPLMNSKLP